MTITQACHELQSIRNDAKSAGCDTDALTARVDAVGAWAGQQRTMSTKLLQVASEAHQLRDKLAGGSGKRGNRIEIVR